MGNFIGVVKTPITKRFEDPGTKRQAPRRASSKGTSPFHICSRPPRDDLEPCPIFKSTAHAFLIARGSKPALFGAASAPIPPSWASSQKKPEKTIKNVLKNGAKWRFFEGLKRHFAVPEADGAKSQPAILADFTSVESNCIEPAAAPEIGGRAPFFTRVGQAGKPDIRSRPSAAVRATSRGVLPSPRCATPLVKSANEGRNLP